MNRERERKTERERERERERDRQREREREREREGHRAGGREREREEERETEREQENNRKVSFPTLKPFKGKQFKADLTHVVCSHYPLYRFYRLTRRKEDMLTGRGV